MMSESRANVATGDVKIYVSFLFRTLPIEWEGLDT